MRLFLQAELLGACEEYGLAMTGTKHELVATLRAHFSSANGVTDAEVALINEAQTDVELVQYLTDKVSQLDQAIQTRTQELQSMHEGDRCAPCFGCSDDDDLKPLLYIPAVGFVLFRPIFHTTTRAFTTAVVLL